MNDQLDIMIERFLAGAMQPEELRSFVGRLRGDPAAKRQLGRGLLHDALLREAIHAVPGQRRHRWPYRLPWLMAASFFLCALAGAGWIIWPNARTPQHHVTEAVPDQEMTSAIVVVSARHASRDGLSVQPGQRMTAGMIATTRDGHAVLRLADGSRIRVGASSSCSFLDGNPRPVLVSGTVHGDIMPRAPSNPFVLRMPGAIAVVLGTSFTATVPTHVAVDNGQVALVTEDGQAASLIEAGGAEALSGGSAWVRFDTPTDILALPTAACDRYWRLFAARRQVEAHAQARLPITVLSGTDDAADLDRCAAIRHIVTASQPYALPISITIGDSQVLDQRIKAGGVARIDAIADALHGIDDRVELRASGALHRGIARSSADEILRIGQRLRQSTASHSGPDSGRQDAGAR